MCLYSQRLDLGMAAAGQGQGKGQGQEKGVDAQAIVQKYYNDPLCKDLRAGARRT